jgi:hypothetical protein
MSLELETLDQLLGGQMPLAVIRSIFPNDERFRQAMLGLLAGGDVELVDGHGGLVPHGNWHASLGAADATSLILRLTERGARRIA